MNGPTRGEIRRERRNRDYRIRLELAEAVTDPRKRLVIRARLVGGYLTACVSDRSLTDAEACAVLDRLAAPVLTELGDEHTHEGELP